MAKRFKQSVVDSVPHLNEAVERMGQSSRVQTSTASTTGGASASTQASGGKRFKQSAIEAIRPRAQRSGAGKAPSASAPFRHTAGRAGTSIAQASADAQAAADAQRRTTPGGFYSMPDFGTESQRLERAARTAQSAMQQKETQLQSAYSAMTELEKSAQFYSEQAQSIYNTYLQNRDPAWGTLFERASANYERANQEYGAAADAFSSLYAEYEPLLNTYNQAAEAYNSYTGSQQEQYGAWRGTIRGQDLIQQDITAADASIQALEEQKRSLNSTRAGMNQMQRRGGLDKRADIAEVDRQIQELDAKMRDMEEAKALLQEELEWSRYFRYADLTQAADFAELSQYRNTANGREPEFNAWSGLYTETGFEDIDYDIINRNEDAMGHQMVNDVNTNASFLGLDNSERRQMTDEEIAIFNYLYAQDAARGDAEHTTAYAYIDYLTGDLNYRQRQEAEQQWAEYARENPAGSSVFSVITSPLKGLSYIGQIADYAEDGAIDQNAGYNRFSYMNRAIRDEVTGIVEENWGGVGSFAYNTGMSMADFLFNTAVSGGNQGMALAIMGTGAAADTTIEAKDRGLSDGQAFALGTIAGAAEVFTEKFSLDKLLNADWEKGALKYILTNAFTEGAEEVGSDIINLTADILIAKDKSQWQAAIHAYMEQGMSEGEAMGKALADQAMQMGLDFLGGAISGGVMSGGASVGNAVSTYSTGRALNNMNLEEGDLQAIIQEGLDSDPSTRSHREAVKLQQQMQQGKTPGTYQLGSLYRANIRAIDAENQGTQLLDKAAEELERKGRVSSGTARSILENVNAVNTLTAQAGLNLTEDMSQQQRREAVKQAISNFSSSTETAAQTEGVVLPTAEDLENQNRQAAEVQTEAAVDTTTEPGMLPTAEQLETRQRMERAGTGLERSGIQAGARDADIRAAQRLSNVLGRSIRFYDGATRRDTSGAANGYYSEQADTIYVNSRSRNPVAQIISHELTHSVEAAEAYNDLSALVLERIRQTGGNLEQMRREKAELYARNGERLAEKGIDQEIVAQYVERYLLTDERSIRELTRQNRSLGQRILSWLNELMARLGSESARERAFVTRARDIYARALQETQSSFSSEQPLTASSPAHAEGYAGRGSSSSSTGTRSAGFPVDMGTEQAQQTRPAGETGRAAPEAAQERRRRRQVSEVDQEAQTRRSEEQEALEGLREDLAAGRITEEEFDAAMDAIMEQEGLAGGEMLEYPQGARRIRMEAELPTAAQYSIDENYQRNIDDWDAQGRPDGEVFVLGATGDVLQGLGAMEQDIYLRSEKVNTILRQHPEMTLTEIKRIPEILDDPVLVLKSRNVGRKGHENSRMIIFGTLMAQDGRPVLAALDLMPTEGRLRIDDMQKVTSAYTKDTNPVGFLMRSEVLYADKKRTAALLRRVGFYMPTGLLRSGSMGSITYGSNSVNMEGVPFDEVVDTTEPQDGGRRYSIDENYERDIDDWDAQGRPDGEVFVLGATGDVLQGLGAMEQDIYLRSEKVNTILRQHPEMTLAEIRRIPEILDDPVLVLKSRNAGRGGQQNTRLVLFGTVRAENGQPVLTVLDLRPVESGLAIDDMQKVNSAYTRNNGANFVRNSEVMYADEKRTTPLLRSIGLTIASRPLLQSGSVDSVLDDGGSVNAEQNRSDSSSSRLAHTGPEGLLRSGYMGSITYRNGTVNLEGVPFDQVVDTTEPQDGGRRYSFGGVNANRADLEALNRAQEMERQGVAMDIIFRETGWYTGADGKWRFEIDDSGMEFRRDGDARMSGEPEYRRMEELTEKWSHAVRDGESLTEQEQAELEQLQERYSELVWEERYRLDDFLKHDALFRAYPRLRGVSLAFDGMPSGEKGYFSPRSNTIVLSDTLFGKEPDVLLHEIQHILQRYEGFARGSSPGYWNRRMEEGYSRRWSSGEEMMPGELYRNTAGEIEARDAAARRELTAEERRDRLPDTGNEDIVFAEEAEDWLTELDAEYGPQLQGDLTVSEADARGGIERAASMEPVASITGEEFRKGETDLVSQVEQFFNEQGNRAYHPELGEVVLDRRGVKSDIGHGIGRKKAAAFAAVPEVIAQGQVVDYQKNWKGRGYDTAVIAAPIEIGGQPYLAGVVLTRSNLTNRFYLHEVLAENDGAAPFKTGAQKLGKPGGDTPSVASILEEIRAVKHGTQSEKASAGAAMEDNQGPAADRDIRYSIREDGTPARGDALEDERVFTTPSGAEVVRNPTDQEYQQLRAEAYQDYPWLWGTGEPVLRHTYDRQGNEYYWRADQAVHAQVEPYINQRYGTQTSQQWQWWTRDDADERPTDYGRQYSVAEEAQLPTAAEYPQGARRIRMEAELPTAAQEESRDIIGTMPVKAQAYLRRAESYLTAKVGNLLSVPRYAQREYLRDIVREISLEYLQEGRVSPETVNELFDRAYDEGVVVDREFYDQYEELRNYLRTVKLTISPEDSADSADFNDFRKSNFGRLNISTQGGTNIDRVYQELESMWPEFFSEARESHPSDQLQHIADVAQSFQVVERNLDEYYGPEAEEFRRWARHDFEAAVSDSLSKLRDVKRYVEDRAMEARVEAPPTTQAEVTEMWGQLKQARRNYEKVMARNLLTRNDEAQVSRLLRGETVVEALDPEKNNVKGIRAVYEAKMEYERLTRLIRQWNQSRKDSLRQQADRFLQTANDWKDKKSGILYSRETMERNIRDIVKDATLAAEINQTYFKPVHDAAAEANRMKNQYRDRVRELKLSRNVEKGNVVSEAHAVQLLGEAEDDIRILEQSHGRLKERDGKNLEEWRAIVKELWEENPKLDQAKIRAAAEQFRTIYDELFQQMNEARVRNGYEPVNYRSGYFPHFQPGNGDGILAQFGKALGIDTEVTALPTTINGLTHAFRPGIRWFGNAQERLGFNTAYDAVEGFDRYIEGVADVIHQTDNIQRLRALASQARYRTGDEGIRKQVDDVRANPNLTEEDKQNRIEKIYETGRFALSNFVVELEEYTNLLANKKSRADRNMEQALGRKMYNLVKALEGRVAANMVAVNPASWLTNFIPLTQGAALLDRGMLLKGMWDTLKAYKADDGIVNKSSFLTNRRGSDPLVRTWVQKASATASRPMEYIDQFVADSLVRARYRQNLGKNMSEDAAMSEADAWVAGVMADRSKGSTPTLFNRSNPVTKVLTQFQLEVNNQLSYLFKDMPRDARDRGLAALAAALLKFFLGAWLFNEVYEYVIGRRPALDPIGILNDTVGDLTGYELPNLVELGVGAASGNLPSFEVEWAGLADAGANLAGQAVEQLPFIGGLLGGGRVPISSAIPNFGNLWNALTNEEWSAEKRLQEVRDELLEKPLVYLALPFGGGQLKKIYEGIEGVIQGGSYSVNKEGERELQFPIYNDTMGQTIGNAILGSTFGRTSLPTGRDWIEGGFDALGAKQTAVYQGLLEAGVPGEEAYDLLKQLRGAEKTETESEAAQERRLLEEADISGDGKSIVYYGLMATDRERELMDGMADMDADMGEVTDTLLAIKDADALTGAAKSNGKRNAIADAALSEAEQIQLYHYAFGEKQEDGSYLASRADDIEALQGVGLSFEQFLEAQNEYSTINEEFDTSGQKAVEFARWVNGQGMTEEQEAAVKDAFTYYSQIPQSGGYYEKFAAAGLDDQSAYDLNEALGSLEPLEGQDQVTSLQKYRAVMDEGLAESDQMTVLGELMPEAEYKKLQTGYRFGLAPNAWVTLKETLPRFDTWDEDGKGKGSYTQEEVENAIDSMDGGGIMLPSAGGAAAIYLTNEERAVLWQLQDKRWKPENNPYSTSVGRRVYDALNAEEGDGGLLLPSQQNNGDFLLPSQRR